MNNLIKQILIGSALGDGHFTKSRAFQTGSKYKQWVDFKGNVLKSLCSDKWYTYLAEQGYSNTPYHKLRTLVTDETKTISRMSLQELLKNMDEIGLAVWLYDDGSFHKNNLFYNLCTHSFSYKEHVKYIIPRLLDFGIIPEILHENKKDGRKFYYTYISKRRGAEVLNKLLKKYFMECYAYKTYPGNINDTLLYKFVKTTNLNTKEEIIHEGINVAARFIKSYSAALKKSMLKDSIIKGFKVEYYYYDYCSTTMAKASTIK